MRRMRVVAVLLQPPGPGLEPALLAIHPIAKLLRQPYLVRRGGDEHGKLIPGGGNCIAERRLQQINLLYHLRSLMWRNEHNYTTGFKLRVGALAISNPD